MEDVSGWFSSEIRQEVYEVYSLKLSNRFKEWQNNRLGRMVIQREHPNKKEGIEAFEVIVISYRELLLV